MQKESSVTTALGKTSQLWLYIKPLLSEAAGKYSPKAHRYLARFMCWRPNVIFSYILRCVLSKEYESITYPCHKEVNFITKRVLEDNFVLNLNKG